MTKAERIDLGLALLSAHAKPGQVRDGRGKSGAASVGWPVGFALLPTGLPLFDVVKNRIREAVPRVCMDPRAKFAHVDWDALESMSKPEKKTRRVKARAHRPGR